jgi:hypothetical protein
MGTCTGVLSSCAIAGYAMEIRFHQGKRGCMILSPDMDGAKMSGHIGSVLSLTVYCPQIGRKAEEYQKRRKMEMVAMYVTLSQFSKATLLTRYDRLGSVTHGSMTAPQTRQFQTRYHILMFIIHVFFPEGLYSLDHHRYRRLFHSQPSANLHKKH